MFNGKKLINVISLVLVLIVNLVYLTKYSVNYNALPYIFIPAYALAVLGGALLLTGRRHLLVPARIYAGMDFRKKLLVPFSVIFSTAVIIYIIMVPRMGEIGRLPAIQDWINCLLNGSFPYNSPYTPSGYPGLFLLSSPFYFIGNIGLLEAAGIVLFFIIVLHVRDSNRGIAVKIFLLVTGIITYFEIVTRSELLFNMMLISVVVTISEKYLDPGKINTRFLLIAMLAGIIMSTRSVAALLFMIYFIYRFRYSLRNLLVFGFTASAVFILLLIPFYWWDQQSFSSNGPFAIQTYVSNLPVLVMLLFFITAVYSGWAISSIQEFFFTGGIILFSAATLSFFLTVSETGFSEALFNDGYDISYFIFCVPLLILALKDYGVDRYKGRIYHS